MVTHPDIEFIYSVGKKCVDLQTGGSLVEFECGHIEADTIIFYIYSQLGYTGNMQVTIIDAEDKMWLYYVLHMFPTKLMVVF